MTDTQINILIAIIYALGYPIMVRVAYVIQIDYGDERPRSARNWALFAAVCWPPLIAIGAIAGIVFLIGWIGDQFLFAPTPKEKRDSAPTYPVKRETDV